MRACIHAKSIFKFKKCQNNQFFGGFLWQNRRFCFFYLPWLCFSSNVGSLDVSEVIRLSNYSAFWHLESDSISSASELKPQFASLPSLRSIQSSNSLAMTEDVCWKKKSSSGFLEVDHKTLTTWKILSASRDLLGERERRKMFTSSKRGENAKYRKC